MDTSVGFVRPLAKIRPICQKTANRQDVATRRDIYSTALHSRIRRAQSLAARHPEISRLPDGPLVVSALLYLTDLADHTVRPFPRQSLANVLEASTRSVDRRLTDLERLGWIERLPQTYDPRSGKWSLSRIRWLSPALLALFPVPSPEPVRSTDRATNLADISVGVPPTPLRIKENPLRAARYARSSETKPQANPLPGVPAALHDFVRSFRIDRRRLAVLLATCKKRKQWLQDVLVFAQPHLERHRLTGNAAVAYLLRMLEVDRDYSFAARQRDQAAREQYRARRRAKLTTRVVESIPVGFTFPEWGRVVMRQADCLIVRDDVRRVERAVMTRDLMVVCNRLGWAFVRRLLRGRAGQIELRQRVGQGGEQGSWQGVGQGVGQGRGLRNMEGEWEGRGAEALHASLATVVAPSSKARLNSSSVPVRMRVDDGGRLDGGLDGRCLAGAEAATPSGATAQAGEGGQGAAFSGQGARVAATDSLNLSMTADRDPNPDPEARQHRPVPAAFAAAVGQLRRAGRGRFDA